MPKEPEKPQPRDAFREAISPDSLRGAIFITEPITLANLRRMVAKLDKPEDGYSVNAIVCYDDEAEQWCVFSLSVGGRAPPGGRYLLYAIPGIGRITPFITKRQVPKGYQTIDTIIRQINDIFGEDTRLNVLFNLEKKADIKNRFLFPEEES